MVKPGFTPGQPGSKVHAQNHLLNYLLSLTHLSSFKVHFLCENAPQIELPISLNSRIFVRLDLFLLQNAKINYIFFSVTIVLMTNY